MELRYHPITAFVLVFTTSLVALCLALGLLALLVPDFFAKLAGTGFLMYLPFMLTFFAAQQALKGNGPPFVHMLHDDLEALRTRFEKRHLNWALAFGLLATAITFGFSTLFWLVGLSGNPVASPFMLTFGLVINIVCSFQAISRGLAPPEAFRPDPDAIEANPAALAAWAVRRMQKNMDKAARPKEEATNQ